MSGMKQWMELQPSCMLLRPVHLPSTSCRLESDLFV